MTFTKPTVLYLALLILLFYAGGLYTFASPPGSPYTVADNATDPSCIPGATNCYVNVVSANSGLTATGSNIQLGGTLSQNTVINQGAFTFTLAQTVPSAGTTVTSQGLTQVTGFPGTVTGYIAPSGDAARHITWVTGGSHNILHTLSGSGDPNLLNGGTEISTSYDLANTASGLITLYAFDTPGAHVTRLQVAPSYINFLFNPDSELQLNGSPGTAGYALTSNGPGVAPTWQIIPVSAISVNNRNTLYSGSISAGQGNTALGSGNNVFLGLSAGEFATNVEQSNFIGKYAGQASTDANNSNFFGPSAGQNATYANYSNFLGYYAGNGATGAYNSNFLGYNAGNGATNAYNSNFLGSSAGNGATSASYSNFLGNQAGYGATSASYSNFLGPSAGQYATNASNSNFFGQSAGNGATSASYSNFFGYQVGYNATSASYSNFLGPSAGQYATNASNSNFLGDYAGINATNASYSNFLGSYAGNGATNAYYSNFFGVDAGNGALNANASNFFGKVAGYGATGASNSNFFGVGSGYGATGASNSNFLGESAGSGSANAYNSNFFGQNAGRQSTNASNSTFIGKNAGYNDLVNNTLDTDDFSILIGNNTSTGGYSNSIALGGSAVNTAANQFMIGSTTRPIDTLVLTGSGGNTCVLDVTVASPSCSSDETLKTNITDLGTNTLENLLKVKTVSYNWKNYPTKGSQIGFLAQDLEQYFPEVVSTAPNGFKTVSYGGMTPILVEAVRELNMKVNALALGQTPTTVFDGIKIWLGDASNGIENIFAKKVTTEQLCVRNTNGETCLSRDDLDRLLQQQQQTPTPPAPPSAVQIPSTDQSTDTPVATNSQ